MTTTTPNTITIAAAEAIPPAASPEFRIRTKAALKSAFFDALYYDGLHEPFEQRLAGYIEWFSDIIDPCAWPASRTVQRWKNEYEAKLTA